MKNEHADEEMRDKGIEMCGECRYWTGQNIKNRDVGLCRRHPPHIFFADGTLLTAFPSVNGDDWCAEFKRKD